MGTGGIGRKLGAGAPVEPERVADQPVAAKAVGAADAAAPVGEVGGYRRLEGADARRLGLTGPTYAQAPFAALAARGAFDGLIKLPSGEEIFARIRPGKNAAKATPIVYLDGLNGAASRAKGLDKLTEKDGHTLVSLALRGQGETLVRDLAETGGKSIAKDIDPNDQVALVIATLDALGVKAPVHLLGLSYGGGIAAAVKKAHPERVSKLLLVAPYTCSMSFHDPVRAMFHMVMNHPWNPVGPAIYRTISQTTLEIGTIPPAGVFQGFEQREAFRTALGRLTFGMEDAGFDLQKVVAGLEDVHFLALPFDPVSPPGIAKSAYQQVTRGTFTEGDAIWDACKHDLIDLDPKLMTKWVSGVLAEDKLGAQRLGG